MDSSPATAITVTRVIIRAATHTSVTIGAIPATGTAVIVTAITSPGFAIPAIVTAITSPGFAIPAATMATSIATTGPGMDTAATGAMGGGIRL